VISWCASTFENGGSAWLQAERDGHQGEYEAGLKELLDERRKLMLEREARLGAFFSFQ
jgi:hypothetical protein